MSLPSRSELVTAVMSYLDSESTEGKELEEIATTVVDGFLDLLSSGLKKPVQAPHLGMEFKHPALSGVWRVQYQEGSRLWLTSERSRYGSVSATHSYLWEHAELHVRTTYRQVDGKRKRVEMTAEEVDEFYGNPDWKVGDEVSRGQRSAYYMVLAVSPNGVLLGDATGWLAEPNENMSKYYIRENKIKGVEW